MFNIGDLMIYSTHGICRVDDICEKTVAGTTRKYYVLHPMEDKHQLTISTPVNNDKVNMLELIHQEDANEILESFKGTGLEWNNNPSVRHHLFFNIVNSGHRKEIANLINTLMRKQIEVEHHEKRLSEQDRKLLNTTQKTLFKELAISLNTTSEKINEMVITMIEGN